jgi:hypothetical protein
MDLDQLVQQSVPIDFEEELAIQLLNKNTHLKYHLLMLEMESDVDHPCMNMFQKEEQDKLYAER